MNEKKLVVVLGPTAVGKTAFAIQLAKHFQTEIISADSRQFYRELKIGVARPSESELNEVKHHFIGFLPIDTTFSAGQFEVEALQLLDKLFEKHDVVICTGGSTLYIDALINGLDAMPSDEKTRNDLISELEDKGIESLVDELEKLDPVYAVEVDQANPHRIIRALEICRITGKKYSELRKGNQVNRSFKTVKIGLHAPREVLYNQINLRVDEMLRAGLEIEARGVYPLRHLNALNTVGYKELFLHFDGSADRSEAIEKIKQHSRNYAKRQLTWWRRHNDIHWLNVKDEKDLMFQALQWIEND